ncbi:MAG TPA: pyruvate kinase [Chthoniobacteraceae bacterium]|jgi:pyruvate kinase|nr:pyruvate kinase [Chthoniobacteraceae bacterium]
MRKTKIIATLGPATDSPEMLRKMIDAGVDIFRLNMSHAAHDWVRRVVADIRSIDPMTAILLDTQGPAIRTGDLATKINLKPGEIFEFTIQGAHSVEYASVDVNYDGLVHDISAGDVVLVDNGVIRMRVLEKFANRIRCEVLTDGVLGSRRHINLPGVRVNLPALTEKDIEDVALGCELGVDFISLSFCRGPEDMRLLKKTIADHGSQARAIAKIEHQLAINNIDAIIEESEGIMVARGDLGIECPMEELPIIQRRIVKKCLRVDRPVIVATHMLESMISNPIPTRAEVTDVANAAFEQADAVMLSGESTVGKYPVQCVKALDTITRRIERSGGMGFANDAMLPDDRSKTIQSAVVLANSLPGSKILVFTKAGFMARFTANLRPRSAPIYAFAPTVEVCRQLKQLWGVMALRLALDQDPEKTIEAAEAELVRRGLVAPEDRLVIVSDLMAGRDRFASIQLRTVRKLAGQ